MKGEDLRKLVAQILDENGRSVSILSSSQNSNIRHQIQLAVQETIKTIHCDGDSSVKIPVILICGSAFIMAEARCALGIVEPRDGNILDDENTDAQEYFVKT